MNHFDDADDRLKNPGRNSWDLHSIYELFGYTNRLPPDASGEVQYQGVRVILRTEQETKRNKSRAMGRIIVECGCGKFLSFGRMEQHAKACEYAAATLYLTPRIPPIEEIMYVIDQTAGTIHFDQEEVLDFIDYCREAWLTIPKDPELQNAMHAEWESPNVTMRWLMSEFDVKITQAYNRIPRFRVIDDAGKVFGTWQSRLQAENAAFNYQAAYPDPNQPGPFIIHGQFHLIDIRDEHERVGNEAHIYGLAAHPRSDDANDLIATGQWDFIHGDGNWVYNGNAPW